MALGSAALCGTFAHAAEPQPSASPDTESAVLELVDPLVERLMADHDVPGLALVVISDGEIARISTYGIRDVRSRASLNPGSIMSGMSWTKFVFSAYVAELAAEGRIDLDRSIADYLHQPLPDYEDYTDLAGDDRWESLTLRLLLSHQSGFPNFRFFPPHSDYEPEAPLAFFQDPGRAYAYSGEGFQIAQLVVSEALDIDIAEDLERRLLAPLGSENIGLTWRESFEADYDAGHDMDGERIGHPVREEFDAAGSINGSPRAFGHLVAAFLDGDLISDSARNALLSPQVAIRSAHQFPPWSDERNDSLADIQLSSGLGVVLWEGPQGRGFFKGGHDRGGDNMMVCLVDRNACILVMMNAPKGHLVFPQIVDALLGDTGLPWAWEYSQLDENN
jgi:CubicO group peptidase (beta-lactamase class C family)